MVNLLQAAPELARRLVTSPMVSLAYHTRAPLPYIVGTLLHSALALAPALAAELEVDRSERRLAFYCVASLRSAARTAAKIAAGSAGLRPVAYAMWNRRPR